MLSRAGKIEVDARVRVLFLLLVAVGGFALRATWMVVALCLLQCLLWPIVGLPLRRLLMKLKKLIGISLFIVISYALVAEDPSRDQWVHLSLGAWTSWKLPLNVYGASVGALMVLRLVTVVIASQVATAGDSRAIAQGMSKLGVPQMLAVSLDAVLASLASEERVMGRGHGGGRGWGGGRGSEGTVGAGGGMGGGGGGGMGGGRGGGMGGGGGGGGMGGGRGGGGGRGSHHDSVPDDTQAAPSEGFWAAFKRVSRGDVGPIADRFAQHVRKVEAHLAQGSPELGQSRARDIAVIAGATVSMLGIRALKVLPSIPFAPGHKLVLLTPLYIIASLKTRTRFGATATGFTMGTVSFLMGDGKYGIFEVLKHVTPGVLCDLTLPLLTANGRSLGAFGWSAFGGFIAAGRFATIFAITLLMQAPGVAYAILLPGMTVHVVFGILSGYVTHHLVRAIEATPRSGSNNDDKDAA